MFKKSREKKQAAKAQAIEKQLQAARETLAAAYRIKDSGERLLAFQSVDEKVREIFGYEAETEKGFMTGAIAGGTTGLAGGAALLACGILVPAVGVPIEGAALISGLIGGIPTLLLGGWCGFKADNARNARREQMIDHFRQELVAIKERAVREKNKILGGDAGKLFESPARDQVFSAFPNVRRAFIESQLDKLEQKPPQGPQRGAGDRLKL